MLTAPAVGASCTTTHVRMALEGFKSVITTAKSLWRVLRKARFAACAVLRERIGDVCVVMGNGPSLNMDVCDHIAALAKLDCVCVNQFADSDLYKEIRPRYYVFADPAYWAPSALDELIQMRTRVFESIRRKTSWPITIYVPYEGKAAFERTFIDAPQVRVACFNNVALTGDGHVLNILYSLGLGLPPVQNVLVAALFLSLRIGYRDVVLLGADHSWHQSLVLDNANRVCARDRHFYDPEAELKPFGQGEFTMDSLFFALGRMFAGYWAIREYAAQLGARIYNASSTTFIDAFERRPLGPLLGTVGTDRSESSEPRLLKSQLT